MIQAKEEKPTLWYQIDKRAKIVLERFYSKPIASTGITTQCPSRIYDVPKTDENYGQFKTDEELMSIYPYVEVVITNDDIMPPHNAPIGRPQIGDDELIDDDDSRPNAGQTGLDDGSNPDTNGQSGTQDDTTPEEPHYDDSYTVRLWIEDVIADGDGVILDGESIKSFFKRNPHDTADTTTYVDAIVNDILATIEEGLENGETLEEAMERLPWYFRPTYGSGTLSATVYCKDSHGDVVSTEIQGKLNMSSDTPLIGEDTFNDLIIKWLNDKVETCRDDISEQFESNLGSYFRISTEPTIRGFISAE